MKSNIRIKQKKNDAITHYNIPQSNMRKGIARTNKYKKNVPLKNQPYFSTMLKSKNDLKRKK